MLELTCSKEQRRGAYKAKNGATDGGGKKGSTVGRLSDPQWVVDATYRRFF